MPPLSISQHPGTDPESVGAIAPAATSGDPLPGGNYVVAVSGHNNATSNQPYLLRVRVTRPGPGATCPGRTFPNAMPAAPGSTPATPTGVDTVFLTDPARLVATYGQAAADQVADSLDDIVTYLQGHPALGITPAIVSVDAYPAVRGAYDDWDAAPCSVAAANEVAAQVTGVIRTLQTANPDLSYVTLVGGDDILPMGRTPDLTRVSNEAQYASTF